MKSSTLTNKVAVQHEEKPQCILLSSGAVVDDFRGTDANPFFQTTLCACSVSFGKAHAPSSRTTMEIKKKIFNQTEMQTVPRRHQPRLVAGDWASQQNTMRYFLVGCFHSASQHGGEAIAPCLAPTRLHSLEAQHRDSCTASLGPRASAKDASVHLAANLAPLRRIIGFRAFTQHERLTLLRYIEDVRGAICLETMPPTHGNAVTTIPLPGDAVLDGMRRVCCHMEIFPHHTRVSHAEQRIFVCDTVSCDGVGVFQPRHAQDAPDGTLSLAQHASGSAAMPLDSPDSRAACGASPHSCWQPCMLLPSGASFHQAWPRTFLHFPAWRQHPNRPHEFLPPQMPSRRWNHSALARWRCTTTSPKRFIPCRFHWRIEVALLAPYFPHDTAESHAK
ncbi:hypothetical protein ECC02_010417 [Trypanosoma cruzi]|uniref:Uncharacterized protein n=1 Tax=Trypanosoma cruzi TaxID=5693 RepID=A0A7J6XRZ1_TRYCR|nr:hypothetical protein ECC02_010417 [Trypanosoma cruzi]